MTAGSKIISRLILILFSISFFISCKHEDEALPASIYQQLVWSEEFDGTNVDGSRWTFETGGGWANNELETYTTDPENVSVNEGTLKITAKYLGTGTNYTSARLNSKGKANFQYGRIEAKIKVPSADGVWPAFWMLPEKGGWPATGEIDIMETANANPTKWFGTLHYSSSGTHQYSGPTYSYNFALSKDFHTYSVEWEPGQIRWYVDGFLRGTQTPSTTVGKVWPFDSNGNFYIILNVAVGGDFTGESKLTGKYPNSTTYQATMEVDYVRVYKK